MKRTLPITLLIAFGALASFAPVRAAAPATTLGPALTQLGAKYEKGWQFNGQVSLSFRTDQPLTEDAWKEIEALSPKYIWVSSKAIDDAAAARFAKLPLEGLSLDGTAVTEAVFGIVAPIKTLKSFGLSHALGVKGTGATALANHPSLTSISIGGTGFGDVGMKPIATLHLTRLGLNHDQITDAGLAALANHPTLESLMFSPQMTPRITDASLQTVGTLKALKELQINDTVLTYDGGLKFLKGLTNLQKLTLTNIGLSDADLAKLKSDLPKVDVKFTAATEENVNKWKAQFEKKQGHK